LHVTIDKQPVHRFTLYLPAHDRFGNPIPSFQRWIDEAVIIMCSIAGGVTTLPLAEGTWTLPGGELVREPVYVMYSNVDPTRFDNQQAIILDFMQRYGIATGQDAVAAEYRNEMIYVRIDRSDDDTVATERRRA
jgi:hypothetical protein